MAEEAEVRELLSADGKRRVLILRRSDGLYCFEEEEFSSEPNEMCWLAVGSRASFFDSEESALREARERVAWLKET